MTRRLLAVFALSSALLGLGASTASAFIGVGASSAACVSVQPAVGVCVGNPIPGVVGTVNDLTP